jgi:putative ABC transport system permease protein
MSLRPLPWEYGIRNLFRRPLRSVLTLSALTVVVLLVLVVVGFVRGLERSLAVSGDPDVVIVYSLGMGENLEYSSIPMSTADVVAASLTGLKQRYGRKYASPELYLGTRVRPDESSRPGMGLVRGVTPAALFVHRRIEIVEGDWPGPGEVLVGRLAATKIGANAASVDVGGTLYFEGRAWRISGTFAAAGSVFESELWCRLDDLQQAMKRQDLSLVALTLGPNATFRDVDVFCKQRLDLELQAIRQTEYFDALREDYAPVRGLAWFVVLLVAGAGVLVGMNTMYGAVVGRVRELAALQAMGYSRRVILLSLLQEGTLLAVAGSLLASVVAFALVNGVAVRFTMGAFALRVDGAALLIGYGVGLLLGVVGTLPAAIRSLRMPIAEGLKAV